MTTQKSIQAWEVTGILARAYEFGNKYPEDVAKLTRPDMLEHLHNIHDITDNDKYWMWARMVIEGFLPKV